MVEFAEFKRISVGENSPLIYLFEGEESYLAENGISHLKSSFCEFPDLNFVRLDGNEVTSEELITQVTAFPFMSKKRVVVVSEFYPTASQIKNVYAQLFTSPVNDTIFVISNKKSSEQLKNCKTITVVNCSKQSSAMLVKWIIREFLQEGKSVATNLALKIAEYSLLDMTKIDNEIKKLISYVGENGEITADDVEKVVIKDTEYKTYEMTEFIGKRQFDKAISTITEMVDGGDSPQALLVSLYYYLRKLFHVALSLEPDEVLATQLSTKPFVVKKMRTQAKAFKLKSLKNGIDALADCDYKFKSGEISIDTAFLIGVFKVMTA